MELFDASENVAAIDHKGYRAWVAASFNERERGLIANCMAYADDDPAGLPGHNLMLLVSKLAVELGISQLELKAIGPGDHSDEEDDDPPTPEVVCLCGSTRFYDAFQEANWRETMAGKIVLSVGFYGHSSDQAHGETVGITPAEKEALDALHLRKIDLADEVLVLNVGGYLGSSTLNEIAYARMIGVPIRWLEPANAPERLR